jgi:predicted RNase H-like HicB family nuclease
MLRRGMPPRAAKSRERARKFRERRNGRTDNLSAMNATQPHRFRIAVHRAKGGYFARVLNLPGCIARGATEVEAVENVRTNIRAYLFVAHALAEDQATVMLEITA